MNKYTFQLTLLAFFAALIPVIAQAPQVSWEINNPQSGSKNYEARDYISLKNGFSYKASGGEKFSAKINPLLVFPPKDALYQTEGGVISGSSAGGGGVVGTLPGSFNVNLSGAATYTIPIECSPGTSGMVPTVSITYNSQAGMGQLGKGFFLNAASSITRVGKNLFVDGEHGSVNFTSNDRFALDGSRMLSVIGVYGANGTEYRTEFESFHKIKSYGTSGTGPSYFIVEAKNGYTMEYGNTSDSRIECGDGSSVAIWYLNKIFDKFGNYIKYNYYENNQAGESYIVSIEYTGNSNASLTPYNKIEFSYASINNPEVKYVGGSKITQSVVLDKIEVKAEGSLVYNYQFVYDLKNTPKLCKVTQSDAGGTHFNPTVFKWGSSSATAGYFRPDREQAVGSRLLASGDFNGDGCMDRINYNAATGKWELLAYSGRQNLFENTFSSSYTTGTTFIAFDINKDGKNDLIEVLPLVNGNKYRNLKLWISSGNGFVSKSQFNCSVLFSSTEDANEFSLGDFDGNGITDIMFINTNNPRSTKWKIFSFDNSQASGLSHLVSGSGGITKETTYCTNSETGVAEVCNPLFSNANSEQMDCNGDGKTDILYFDVNNVGHVMTFNGTTFVELFNTNVITKPDHLVIKDVNNDGLMDIYMGSECFLSTGKGFVKNDKKFSFDEFESESADYNGDGYSDSVSIGYESESQEYVINIRYSQGDGTIANTPTKLFSIGKVRSPGIIEFHDYDGDGFKDFLFYKDNSIFVGFVVGGVKNRRVTSITNGIGNSINISYSPLTNSLYTKGSSSSFPFMDVINSNYIVYSVSSSNGVGGTNSVRYNYTGLKTHLTGRGNLGFESITVWDNARNTKTVRTYEIEPTNVFPYLKREQISLFNGTSIASKEYTMQVKKLSAGSLFPFVSQIVDNNTLYGTTETTTLTYDDYGNQTQSYTNHSGVGSTKVESVFVTAGAWLPSKAQQVTLTKSTNGQPSIVNTTDFTYHSTGSIYTQTVNSGTSKNVVTTYTYNTYGLPTKVETKGADVGEARIVSYDSYDSKYRFPTKVTNALGQTTCAVYDAKTGNILESTDINGLKTINEYDGFGRRTKTTASDGTMNVNALLWCKSGNSIYYSYSQSTANPPVKVYYDQLGRSVQTVQSGFDGSEINSSTSYNAKGQVSSQTAPHTSSDVVVKAYTYDDYGRVSKINGTLDNTSISYSVRSLTVTSYQGTKTKTLNLLGQIESVVDQGGTISYTYNSAGQPLSITSGGVQMATIGYDDVGNQISLSEPNSGNHTYTYNAFGELLSQDQNGKKTTLTYDKLGRVKTKTEAEGTTVYTYDTREHGLGLVSSILDSNGDGEEFFYDSYGRVASQKVIIGGTPYLETIGYNKLGQVESLSYPSGFGVKYKYNDQFYLSEVLRSDNGKSIWKADKMNAYGQMEQYTLGNNLTTIKTYNKGYISGIKTGNVQEDIYNWDLMKGNLKSRTDAVHDLSESFTYDNLNRLTQDAITNGPVFDFAYESNGNISNSTVAGNYTYDTNKINALVTVNYNESAFSSDKQLVSYTSFNKIKTITEGVKSAVLNYGIHQQRVKMSLTDGTSSLVRIYTHGNYEQESGSVNRQVHYISAGDGVSAVYIKEGSSGQMYYIHKDHLGSVTAITDDKGSVVEQHSFDAWGRRRNPTNWTYDNVPVSGVIDRGYTGHEHLDQFGLINMNGRVYDPVVGRFLSPDMVVQAPDNTQSYNRYSYCLNNPFKYTDPTGWYGENSNGGAGEGFSILPQTPFGPTNSDRALWNSSELTNSAWIMASSPGGSYDAALVSSGYTRYIRTDYYCNTDGYVNGELVSHKSELVRTTIDIAANGGGITVPYVLGGMENSAQALSHYFNGHGTPVTLGNNTIRALVLSDGFQARHQRIISGKTTSLTGSFSVNLTGSVFHIGRTNVDYSINCANGNCTVTYDMFVRDGFWDPDFIDEYFMGRLSGEPLFQPDGPGPNLERFGGTPYPYNPVRGTYTFPNPGY